MALKGTWYKGCNCSIVGAVRKELEYNNKHFVCYVDYEGAFNQVNWVKMMEILRNIGTDWKDRKFIWNLYKGQAAYMIKRSWPI